MFQIPILSRTTLAKTHRSVAKHSFELARDEQWAVGQAGMFLHEAGTLHVEALKQAVDSNDRGQITKAVYEGLADWDKALESASAFSEITKPSLPVEIGLYCHTNYETGEPTMSGRIIAHTHAYDLKPLEMLDNADATIVAKAVAEMRNLLLPAFMLEDIEEYHSWQAEVLKDLEQWLPDEVRNNPDDNVVRDYCNKNNALYPDACNDFYGDDADRMIKDFLAQRVKRPDWYAEFSKGVGDKKPKLAISSLCRAVGRVGDSGARLFVKHVIESIRVFLRHFKTHGDWMRYQEKRHEYESDYVEEEGCVYLESGFLLSWGTEGYWWDIVEDFGQMQMQAGETPIYRAWAETPETRLVFRQKVEAVYRGAAILMKLAELTDSLRDKTDAVERAIAA